MLTASQRAALAINCVFPVLAVIITGLRLYARKLMSLSLGADDYMILAALLSIFVISIPFIYAITNGAVNTDIDDISPMGLVFLNKVIFLTQFPYIVASSLVKLSILVLYNKIFTTKKFHTVVKIMKGVVITWSIIFFSATLFQAWPISLNWNISESSDPASHRIIDPLALYLALACTELFLDILTLTLPWQMIWSLQMDTKRKWAVSGIFTLGGLVCIASIFRIYYWQSEFAQDYAAYHIFVWTSIEPGLGIICASLPILRPVFTASSNSRKTIFSSIYSHIHLYTTTTRNFWNRNCTNLSITGPSLPEAGEDRDAHRAAPDDAIILTGMREGQFKDVDRDVDRDVGSQE